MQCYGVVITSSLVTKETPCFDLVERGGLCVLECTISNLRRSSSKLDSDRIIVVTASSEFEVYSDFCQSRGLSILLCGQGETVDSFIKKLTDEISSSQSKECSSLDILFVSTNVGFVDSNFNYDSFLASIGEADGLFPICVTAERSEHQCQYDSTTQRIVRAEIGTAGTHLPFFSIKFESLVRVGISTYSSEFSFLNFQNAITAETSLILLVQSVMNAYVLIQNAESASQLSSAIISAISAQELPTNVTSSCPARIGLLGNPSDGFYGKTLSTLVGNFSANVMITATKERIVEFLPHPVLDPMCFGGLADLRRRTSIQVLQYRYI